MLYCICYALSTEWREQMIEEHRDVMMEIIRKSIKRINTSRRSTQIYTQLKGFFWIFVTILLLWLLTLVRIFIVDSRIFTMAAGVSAVMGIPVLYIYKRWICQSIG